MDTQISKMEETVYKLEALKLENRQEKLRTLALEEMRNMVNSLGDEKTAMKKLLFQNQGIEFTDVKVDALSKAGALLSEAKDVQSDAMKVLNRATGDEAKSSKHGD